MQVDQITQVESKKKMKGDLTQNFQLGLWKINVMGGLTPRMITK